jgi:hypothetical protein
MGMLVTYAPRLIEKENVSNLHFPKEDVISISSDRQKRMKDLMSANELGDLAQYKVKILFEDDAGLKKVETTVWKTTKKDVVLKFGIKIPIRRVSKVYFP